MKNPEILSIGSSEVAAACENKSISRLQSFWLAYAVGKVGPDWANVKAEATRLGVTEWALDAVESHVHALPWNQRGFVTLEDQPQA